MHCGNPTHRKACPVLLAFSLLLGILILGSCMQAYGADKELELVVHGFSLHFQPLEIPNESWNPINPGIALRYPLNQRGSFAIQGGRYKNSYARNSLYLGIDWIPLRKGSFAFGAGLGTATGYPIYNGKPILMGGFMMQWKTTEQLRMRMRFMPPVAPKTTGVLSLEFGWRLPKIEPVRRWLKNR